MRIGIDARLWNETGVGRYIRNLVRQLQRIDSENQYVLFITPETLNEKFFRLSYKENPHWKIVETDVHWHTVEEQLVFHKVLENEFLDLVHFPYFSIPIMYTRPFVITIHDLIINHFPTGKASTLPAPVYKLKHFAYNFVLKQAAKNACRILAVSEATKKEIIDHLPVNEEKIVVTYEGVDENILKQELETKNITDSFFLYVGNAYPHKNLDRLIDAFALLNKKHPRVKLILVGKKNYFYNRLQGKVLKLNLQDKILFLSRISDEELSGLYGKAKGLITPSLMEGFGLPGLEAMQHNCLVLASNIPVYKEIYQDAAIYFDPLNVDSIHATIQQVLEKKQLYKENIKKGNQRVKVFSWKEMAQDTLKVYESCTSLRPYK